jgi:hypothetical protein
MNEFIAKYRDQLEGVISGFDRLVFHGHLRTISSAQDMESYLAVNRILKKDFGRHVQLVSQQLKEASLAEAHRGRRPVIHLRDNEASKEDLAQEIARRDKVREGLICVLTAVEVCWSFKVMGERESQRLKLKACTRKCLHLYHYWMDPEIGLMSARIQSWFPFPIQVCLNGREWLARQMDREKLKYVRQDNCFVWLQDYGRAQSLLDAQLRRNWAEWLNPLAQRVNPIHEEIFQRYRTWYYWSTYQSEWATDLVFRDGEALRRHYGSWIEQALATFGSTDVMRFLGRKVPLSGNVPRRFAGQLRSDLQERSEGIRIKHSLNGNSVKAYDKAFTLIGNVLRVETTLNRVEDFRVYRPKEGGAADDLDWRPLRKGVADLHRRAEVSQKANERYLNALASLDDSTRLEEVMDRLSQRVAWNGKRLRGLRPWEPADSRLLAAISRGEFSLNGLRNRHLRPLLFDLPANSPEQARRQSAQVSRLLRLLRAHGLLQKVPRTHRYQVTAPGRKALTAILAARHATVAQLAKVA